MKEIAYFDDYGLKLMELSIKFLGILKYCIRPVIKIKGLMCYFYEHTPLDTPQ